MGMTVLAVNRDTQEREIRFWDLRRAGRFLNDVREPEPLPVGREDES